MGGVEPASRGRRLERSLGVSTFLAHAPQASLAAAPLGLSQEGLW